MAYGVSFRTLTKGRPSRLPFVRIKREILGDRYVLSVVYTSDAHARALNKKFRNKNTPTNVLSFPLGVASGEIFLNLAQARRDAQIWAEPEKYFFIRLFIHACLHLKGMRHGSIMERSEERMLKKHAEKRFVRKKQKN